MRSNFLTRKSLPLWWSGVLRIRWFDPIAEASLLPDYSCGALLLRLFGDRWAPFFVTDSLAQDQPDQTTLSMGNGPDGLVMSQARDRAAIDHFEDTSFGPGCGVGRLVENPPHVAVALRRSVAVVHSRAFVVAGAGAHAKSLTVGRLPSQLCIADRHFPESYRDWAEWRSATRCGKNCKGRALRVRHHRHAPDLLNIHRRHVEFRAKVFVYRGCRVVIGDQQIDLPVRWHR